MGGVAVRKSLIAIVDNDVRMLNYMRKILADGEWNVATYGSGEHALECLRDGSHPNMILISSDLRDVDCLELIRKTRQQNPHIAIVAMSYANRFDNLVATVRTGAKYVLQKPFLPNDLLKLVEQLKAEPEKLMESDGVEIRIGDRMS
jgi:DNA-binding NtrC family response regulator